MKKTLLIVLLIITSFLPLFSQISLDGFSGPPPVDFDFHVDQEEYTPGSTALLSVNIIFPEGYHQSYDAQNFRLSASSSEHVLYGSTIYEDGVLDSDGFIQYYDSTTLSMELKIGETSPEGQLDLPITLHYQLCDDNGVCFFPQNESINIPINIIKTEISEPGRLNTSILLMILMAFIGGFLLNLMPCVLPLLSVKAMNLIHQSGENKKVLIRHGLFYSLGILLSFWSLSLLIILLQKSGKILGWGFHFQSPLFIAILMSGIFLFSLSLFEVFIVLPPTKGLNKADSLSRTKGYSGSFFTGIFAVFVATPCTAPFLGTAMGFAFSQSPFIILMIMTMTGLGLAFPFIILGFFPQFFNALPKPGKWMDRFREAMAFLLMGTVVYLASTLINQVGNGFVNILWFLLVLAVLAWLWGWISRTGKSLKKTFIHRLAIMVILIMTGIHFLNFSDIKKSDLQNPVEDSVWEQFDAKRISELQAEGKSIFLAFSADWCTSCKVNEKTVLNTDDIQTFFKTEGIHLMKADLTLDNPEAMKWLREYQRAGVPFYQVFIPGEEIRILPEILTASMVKDAFQSNQN